jgi:hypothetical protein
VKKRIADAIISGKKTEYLIGGTETEKEGSVKDEEDSVEDEEEVKDE